MTLGLKTAVLFALPEWSQMHAPMLAAVAHWKLFCFFVVFCVRWLSHILLPKLRLNNFSYIQISKTPIFVQNWPILTKKVTFSKCLPAIFSMVGPFAGLFCCERYCCEISCGTRPLKLLKGTNPFIWYPAIIIDVLELSLTLWFWNSNLWKISNQSFIFIRSDKKLSGEKEGALTLRRKTTNPSPRKVETAPPRTMFAFCSPKDNVGCSYDSTSKKSCAHKNRFLYQFIGNSETIKKFTREIS